MYVYLILTCRRDIYIRSLGVYVMTWWIYIHVFDTFDTVLDDIHAFKLINYNIVMIGRIVRLISSVLVLIICIYDFFSLNCSRFYSILRTLQVQSIFHKSYLKAETNLATFSAFFSILKMNLKSSTSILFTGRNIMSILVTTLRERFVSIFIGE